MATRFLPRSGGPPVVTGKERSGFTRAPGFYRAPEAPLSSHLSALFSWCYTLSNPRMSTQRYRYVFTVFAEHLRNPDMDTPSMSLLLAALTEMKERAEAGDFNRLTVQLEMCPETSRYHLQGMVCLKRKVRANLVAHELGLGGCHAEPMAGTPDQAAAYCSKKESRVRTRASWVRNDASNQPDGYPCLIYGSTFRAGARTDLQAFQGALQEGRTMHELSNEFFPQFLRYQKGIAAYRDANPPESATTLTVRRGYYIYGPPGFGKSTWLFTRMGASAYYYDGSSWFNGYDGQQVIIIDDVDPSELQIKLIKWLADPVPRRYQYKGGYLHLEHKTVIIVTNKPYNEWIDALPPHDRGAVARRYKSIPWMVDLSGGRDVPPLATVALPMYPVTRSMHEETSLRDLAAAAEVGGPPTAGIITPPPRLMAHHAAGDTDSTPPPPIPVGTPSETTMSQPETEVISLEEGEDALSDGDEVLDDVRLATPEPPLLPVYAEDQAQQHVRSDRAIGSATRRVWRNSRRRLARAPALLDLFASSDSDPED